MQTLQAKSVQVARQGATDVRVTLLCEGGGIPAWTFELTHRQAVALLTSVAMAVRVERDEWAFAPSSHADAPRFTVSRIELVALAAGLIEACTHATTTCARCARDLLLGDVPEQIGGAT